MAPEVLNAQGHNTMSDWWSFGILLYELASGDPPFMHHDPEVLADEIRFEDIPMKKYFSKDLKDLIEQLTHKNPAKRLGNPKKGGIDGIKNHPFFKGVDWKDVLAKKTKPPFVPHKGIRHSHNDHDCEESDPFQLLEKNFDKHYTSK